jgi:hypothetical protein
MKLRRNGCRKDFPDWLVLTGEIGCFDKRQAPPQCSRGVVFEIDAERNHSMRDPVVAAAA